MVRLHCCRPKRWPQFHHDTFVACCRSIFGVYLITSVSWRLAFCPQFTLNTFEFPWFVAIDLLSTVFFSYEIFQQIRAVSSSSTANVSASVLPTQHEPTEQQKNDGLGNSMLNCRRREIWKSWCSILFFIISTFPFEYISNESLVNYIMLNRLLLLMYLPDYLNDLAGRYFKNIGVQRTWLLFFTMGMAAHLCACGFYFVAYQEAMNGVIGTWPEAAGIWIATDENAKTAVTMTTSKVEAYITSLYWACVTMITTGFGDIVPLHLSETVWCIISMFIGVLITALTIANIQSLVTSIDAPRLNFQRKMEMINKYMSHRHLPKGLKDRVLAFYDYQWTMLKGANEADILLELPQTLQQQVTNFMYRVSEAYYFCR